MRAVFFAGIRFVAVRAYPGMLQLADIKQYKIIKTNIGVKIMEKKNIMQEKRKKNFNIQVPVLHSFEKKNLTVFLYLSGLPSGMNGFL